MGRSRHLCYAMHAERRRRENGEEESRPGVMPLLGRGIRPMVPRFQQWDGFQQENFNLNYMARGRSRSFPTPQPYLQIHYRNQPHSLPCCLAAGFGYVAPNVQFPRLSSLPLCAPNPPHYVPPPPPLLKIKSLRLKVPPQSPLTLRKVTPLKPIGAPLKLTYFYLLFYFPFLVLIPIISYFNSFILLVHKTFI